MIDLDLEKNSSSQITKQYSITNWERGIMN